MKTPSQDPEILWNPAENGAEKSRLADFARFAGEKDCDKAAYDRLQQWAVQKPEEFWSKFWDFSEIIGDKGKTVIQAIDQVPWARFFPDSKINYAENILRDRSDKPAIIARTQDGPDKILTWKQLYEQVSLWEQALRAAGITEGDKVAVYLPNIPEAMIILFAASSIGAVFASAGMEMGQADLINRFSQVKPKILVTTSGYVHGSKTIDRGDVIEKVKQNIPSLTQIVMLGDDFLAPFKPKEITFKRRDFNHPLYILFSSGSTGKPKCFEHSTGGILIKHMAEQQLNCDVRSGDRVFYHATPSWMMWNWLASVPASGGTILLYDGSPAHPDAYAQWEFTSAHACTHHGTAAPVILSWAQNHVVPKDRYDLKPLRTVMSTGAVLPAQGFTYIHEHVKRDVKIGSISGGTDIVGCFVGGNIFTPTYAGQINGPMLGMDVRVWDDDGRETQTGELVCVNPFPSMPLRFVDDENGERYEAEYFGFYSGKHAWRHGDSVEKTAQDQFVIIGRSDATLNQNGVRIGTVAIYDQLAPFAAQIKDAAAIDYSRPDNKQTITILFLALKSTESEVPQDLQKAIKTAVKDNITPYAIPTEIIAVPGILRTPNGKIAEVVMKKVVAGKTVPNATLYGEALVKFYEDIGHAMKKKYS